MKDFQLQLTKTSDIVKRKDGSLVKSFTFHADELAGWIIELAALNKTGDLNIILVKRSNTPAPTFSYFKHPVKKNTLSREEGSIKK